MDWGMQNRMAKLVRPETGHTVMMAVDHGYFLGPTTKLEEPRKTIEPLLPYADSIMLTRGILRSSVDARITTPIVLRVSGGTSIVGKDLSDEGIITSVRDAIRLNAVGLALSIFVGTEHEHQTLMNLSRLVDEAEEYGIPVLAVTAVGKELERRDARYLALCCRIAAELGARIVKTYYCDEFEKVVGGCPAPLVIAGGPKLATEMDVFQLTHDAIQKGAVGVDMGRNIWQSDYPVAMIKTIRAIVHEGATPREAQEMYDNLTKQSEARKIENIEELERYAWDKLIVLGISGTVLSSGDTAWLLDDRRRVTIMRRQEQRLVFQLVGRWHIKDTEGVDRFIEDHVKPMIDELNRQDRDRE